VVGHAHALALAAKQQRALFLDEPDVERRLPLSVFSRKGDEREDLVAELLDEAGAQPHVTTALSVSNYSKRYVLET